MIRQVQILAVWTFDDQALSGLGITQVRCSLVTWIEYAERTCHNYGSLPYPENVYDRAILKSLWIFYDLASCSHSGLAGKRKDSTSNFFVL
jgi:hypothetical protein